MRINFNSCYTSTNIFATNLGKDARREYAGWDEYPIEDRADDRPTQQEYQAVLSLLLGAFRRRIDLHIGNGTARFFCLDLRRHKLGDGIEDVS